VSNYFLKQHINNTVYLRQLFEINSYLYKTLLQIVFFSFVLSKVFCKQLFRINVSKVEGIVVYKLKCV